jgi:hypothetical protein
MNDKMPQQHKVGMKINDTCTDEVGNAAWPFWIADAVRKVAGMNEKTQKRLAKCQRDHLRGNLSQNGFLFFG